MEGTTTDPMQVLGMMGMDIETVVKIMLESRGIVIDASLSSEPTEEEIEEMWNRANGSESV